MKNKKEILSKQRSNAIKRNVKGSNFTRHKGGMKPCPFCAREPKTYKFSEKIWTVACKCGCEAPRDSSSENGAKRIWNRRIWDYLRENAG